MKREEKLLHAIGNVQDYMVTEAMEKKKGQPLLRWAAAAACFCLLLTTTVGAEKWGLDWWHGQELGYIHSSDPELGHTAEWKYPFEPVSIRQEALDEMTAQLNMQWVDTYEQQSGIDSHLADYHFLTGLGEEIGTRITTIGELEEYLGIDLIISPQIDTAARSCMESNQFRTWLEIDLYGDINREAEAEYQQNGQITLQGIAITVRMGYSNTNCKSWMEIFIPITQAFADTYPESILFNYKENLPFQMETQQFSEREVLVVLDSVEGIEHNPKAYGVYEADGIGYCVHCMAEDWGNTENHPTVYQHGAERLMELLENLE